jgi:hypothetical protein
MSQVKMVIRACSAMAVMKGQRGSTLSSVLNRGGTSTASSVASVALLQQTGFAGIVVICTARSVTSESIIRDGGRPIGLSG